MPVVFTAAEAHLTKTMRGEEELTGSVHHPEMTQFSGLVGRLNADGTADIVIFAPGRDPKWVTGVTEGCGPGQIALIGDKADEG